MIDLEHILHLSQGISRLIIVKTDELLANREYCSSQNRLVDLLILTTNQGFAAGIGSPGRVKRRFPTKSGDSVPRQFIENRRKGHKIDCSLKLLLPVSTPVRVICLAGFKARTGEVQGSET